jgi:5-oxoprolinase (ATP-hydrolysing)
MNGGEDGARGTNTWFRKTEEGEYEAISVSSNGIAKLKKGDRVRIQTPGGGGWGKPVA